MEIERKFLLKSDWRQHCNGLTKDINQIYLMNLPDASIRIGASVHKQDGEEVDRKAYLTIKIPRDGMVRDETEFEIDHYLANELISYGRVKGFPSIRKTRYHIQAGSLLWEIDEFLGEKNYKVIIAEVELPEKGYQFVLPSWVGIEVTHNPKFYNAFLAECREPPTVADTDPEIEENFINRWSFLLNSDGTVDLEQLKLELADFSHLIREVPSVYDHVTGGLLTKHMYSASTINSEADKYYWRMHRDMILDDIEGMDVEEIKEYLRGAEL